MDALGAHPVDLGHPANLREHPTMLDTAGYLPDRGKSIFERFFIGGCLMAYKWVGHTCGILQDAVRFCKNIFSFFPKMLVYTVLGVGICKA